MLVGSAKMREGLGIGYGRARTLTSTTVAALMSMPVSIRTTVQNTPVGKCANSLTGKHAPHNGKDHCDRFTECLTWCPRWPSKKGFTSRCRSPKSTSRASMPGYRWTFSSTTLESWARCATSPPARPSRSWWSRWARSTRRTLPAKHAAGHKDAKIKCGEAHFAALGGGENPARYMVATSFGDLLKTM